MLHGFDAGELVVHMGLSTADLTLESLNSCLFLLDFPSLVHCWGLLVLHEFDAVELAVHMELST